jgi:hypothetical protein
MNQEDLHQFRKNLKAEQWVAIFDNELNNFSYGQFEAYLFNHKTHIRTKQYGMCRLENIFPLCHAVQEIQHLLNEALEAQKKNIEAGFEVAQND